MEMPKNASEMTKSEQPRTLPPVLALLERMKPEIERALPKLGFDENRFARLLQTAFRTTPKLMECNINSVAACIIELAQLGLEPSTPLGHAWMIPFKKQAQVVVGYKGFIALAYRAGIILNAEVVYERDQFEWAMGTEAFIKHRPFEGEGPGAIKYGYAVGTLPDGRKITKVITRGDIARAQGASASYQKHDGPWFTDEASMVRKTAIRRIAPFLPLSSEFMRAIQHEEAMDRGEIEVYDYTALETKHEVAMDEIDAKIAKAKEPVETVAAGTEPLGERGASDKA